MRVRVFSDETSIWTGKLSSRLLPPQCGYASANLLRAWIEKKGRGRRNSSIFLFLPGCLLLDLRHRSFTTLGLDLHHWFPWISGLWTQTGPTARAFLGLLLPDGRLQDFLAYIIMWPNFFIKISSYIHMCVCLYTHTHIERQKVFLEHIDC